MFRIALLSFVCLSFFPFAALAADTPKSGDTSKQKKEFHPVYTDPKDAGPDYAIQGEYAGEIPKSKAKLGVQVIGLGDGAFTAVIHTGGLPGEGWDGKPRIVIQGHRDGDKTSFDGSGYAASITNGAFTGKTQTGHEFELKKVERVSPDEGAKPPAGAIVLFDGTSVDAFNVNGKPGEMDDRHFLKQGTKTRQKFQDFKLHVEFMLPFKPFGRDQDRGNSGIYIQDRYEIQVLDTFGHPEEFNGCAATYRQTAPKVNMCYPPLRWQTYDIDFTAPKWDADGKKTANAHVTLRHNGVVVQDNTELPTKTGAGAKEGPEAGPIQLQEHHNPVFFRNIWIVEKK
jgi:hypothetical protein